jgi:hypothetical protein
LSRHHNATALGSKTLSAAVPVVGKSKNLSINKAAE